MVQLSEYVLESLSAGEEFTLYRGRHRAQPDAPSILVLAAASIHPGRESLKRLEHEFSLRGQLDPAWAVRAISLSQYNSRSVLVLADPGGVPLERSVQAPMEIGPFLRLAIGISNSLEQMHKQGLIHKDIKPSHILVDPVTGQTRLMGFGMASQLKRERQHFEPPEFIAGTLAYMAPEQTGRMNRSIDSRSDLYSLGITLYQMLTGSLPFKATDPTEWVHCHIAKQAVPPACRLKSIPACISAIVMKLLAKTPEERYQTGAGVNSDLRRCQAALDTLGFIEDFALGQYDIPDRLLIPEKLYGRAQAIEILLASFDRVVSSGKPELVLVSGYSGIGKSSVVNELHKELVPSRGLFASGKFDQYKRDVPYATVAQAFQNLVRPLLSKSDSELATWRDALREALGPNGRLMVDLVPELTLIMGEQPAIAELPPQDAQRRFQLVLRRFISVFARPEHPLALFLDDLQWLDAATLDLLAELVVAPDVQQLILIGAYRDNEVDRNHPLMRKLDTIRQSGAEVQDIVLRPLACEDIEQLTADALRGEPEQSSSLAHLIHEKTAGNPFFAIQFISDLNEERLLTFDRGAGRWSWELEQINAKSYTDNVVDLMVGKLNRLPAQTQKALQQLACLGNTAPAATFAIVHGTSEDEARSDVWEAVRQEYVFSLKSTYRFVHDRVQEAAYSLVPIESRATLHLRIGRLLAASTPMDRQEEAIFDIVNQFNRATVLITAPEERQQVSELNLIAGKRAKTSAAYGPALNYLVRGVALLRNDCWERQHDLAFSLELDRAECEFLSNDIDAAAERLMTLSTRAVNSVELARVTCLLVDVFSARSQLDRAVATCLDYMRYVGVEWSSHPTDDEVRTEYSRAWLQIGDREIEDLIDLPLMSDPASLATLDVLTKSIIPALLTDTNLLYLVTCKAVNLGLENGYSDGSCFAYVYFGTVTGYFGDYQIGFRLGRLGYDLVERRGLKRFQDAIYLCFGLQVMPWTKHIRVCRELLLRAFEIANRAGNLNIAVYCQPHLNTNLIAAGDPLDYVHSEAEKGFEFARQARFGFVMDEMISQLVLVRTLRGTTIRFGSFDDDQFDEQDFEDRLQAQPGLTVVACWYWIRKLQARFFAADYTAALDAAAKAKELLWSSPSTLELAEYEFFSALSHAARCSSVDLADRQTHMDAVASHQTQLETWARNCPENFDNRAALVKAEIARVEGRELDAERLYERAIHSAHANQFVHNEALANELAARFYAARGLEKIASKYLIDARYGYLDWGAIGKVRELDELYPDLVSKELTLSPTRTIQTPFEHLDLATVLKINQAISGEIILERLIDTLMRTAMQDAGAEIALLILMQDGEPRVHAEAITGADSVIVQLAEGAVNARPLPTSIIQYVVRTRENVVLDDASADNAFSADSYIRQHHSRSVICLPMITRGNLIGVLYLENNLTPRAFTASRLTVLKLLASQAAISLENTRLYGDLRESQAYLAEAQRLSQTGSWAWNPTTGETRYWSQECFRVLGFDPAMHPPQFETFLQRIHPDDQLATRERFEKAIRAKQDFELDYRYAHATKGLRDIHVIGHAVIGVAGDLAEFVGTVIDITERKRAEEELQQLVDLVPQLIVVLDATGAFIHANRVAREYTGLTLDQYRSMDVVGAVIHPDDADHMRSVRERAFSGTDPFEVEARLLGKDGVYRWFLFRYNPFVEETRVKRWYASATEIESRKQEEERVKRENVRLEERTRIAQELHDTLLQTFLAASLQLGATVSDIPPELKVREKLDRILEVMEQGIEEGRHTIQGLRTLHSLDLVQALSRVQQDLGVNPDIDFRVGIHGDQRPLRPNIWHEVYRIGKEALINAFNHSRANCVDLEVDYSTEALRVIVRDNGLGIDSEILSTGREGHWGLAGMRERSTRIGGRLDISSANSGTEVQLSIPSYIALRPESVDDNL